MAEEPANWNQMTLREKVEWRKALVLNEFAAIEDQARAREQRDFSAMSQELPVRTHEKPDIADKKATPEDTPNSAVRTPSPNNDSLFIPETIDSSPDVPLIQIRQIRPSLQNACISPQDTADASTGDPPPRSLVGLPVSEKGFSVSVPDFQDRTAEPDQVKLQFKIPTTEPSISGKIPSASTIQSVFSDRRSSNRVGTIVPKSTLKRKVSDEPESLISKDKRNSEEQPISPTEQGPAAIDTKIQSSVQLPDWYSSVAKNTTKVNRGGEKAQLTRILNQMEHYKKAQTAQDQDSRLNEIRRCLHEYEHSEVDAFLVKASKLMEFRGLPQLFQSGEYPFDIRADAKALYRKWFRADFNPDMLRGIDDGIKSGKGGKVRYSAKFDGKFSNLSAAYEGEGDLVNGMWWPSRLAALRDGAHGSGEAGIYGPPDVNYVVSIVISGSHYEDEDHGDTIWYCGTEGSEGRPTEHTKRMIQTINTHRAVRVLRTHKLPENNPWRPAEGIRYDGLYEITDYKLLNKEMAHYRFELKRRPGQDPIRNAGVGARPTAKDIWMWHTHRTRMGR